MKKKFSTISSMIEIIEDTENRLLNLVLDVIGKNKKIQFVGSQDKYIDFINVGKVYPIELETLSDDGKLLVSNLDINDEVYLSSLELNDLISLLEYIEDYGEEIES